MPVNWTAGIGDRSTRLTVESPPAVRMAVGCRQLCNSRSSGADAHARGTRAAESGPLFPRAFPRPPRKIHGGHRDIADRRGGIDFNEECPKHGEEKDFVPLP